MRCKCGSGTLTYPIDCSIAPYDMPPHFLFHQSVLASQLFHDSDYASPIGNAASLSYPLKSFPNHQSSSISLGLCVAHVHGISHFSFRIDVFIG